MGNYNLFTTHGYNMYEMASLLQKGVRRGNFNDAGSAANELYSNVRGVLWNRILTIASEDCWGVLTKEIIELRRLDEAQRKGTETLAYVSRAVALMCKAKKSRDACYFACNFILTLPPRKELSVNQYEVNEMSTAIRNLPDDVFSIGINSLDKPDENELFQRLSKQETMEQMTFDGMMQISLDEKKYRHAKLKSTPDGSDPYYMATVLKKAILSCDMENIGYAIDQLRGSCRKLFWEVLLVIASVYTGGSAVREVIAQKIADDYVNSKKPADKKDEIYLSKATMILCYEVHPNFESIESEPIIDLYSLIDWEKVRVQSVANCKLVNGVIPEYVFDVHTIRGKRAGKTDWDMNVAEQAALTPLQKAFFDEGSWEFRYDYKIQAGICPQKDMDACLEYRKTHVGNPVTPIQPIGKTMNNDWLAKRIRELCFSAN